MVPTTMADGPLAWLAVVCLRLTVSHAMTPGWHTLPSGPGLVDVECMSQIQSLRRPRGQHLLSGSQS